MSEKIVTACELCGCAEFKAHETLYLVSGQVDGPRSETVVATCSDCGARQTVS